MKILNVTERSCVTLQQEGGQQKKKKEKKKKGP